MDTRIGFPNEHLAGDSEDDQTSPVFSTAVGLLMTALKENYDTNELSLKMIQRIFRNHLQRIYLTLKM